jgi:hypothetical protein
VEQYQHLGSTRVFLRRIPRAVLCDNAP